ncbi:MAG TPA: hypothetical protein VNT02_07720 [Burkholderiales bacterium]|nr:hypothetical protein [Burkholderiales bacterium]
MAQQGLGNQHRNKCGHEGCACLIAPSDHFCSDYCAGASKAAISGTMPGQRQQGGPCKCGHSECQHGAH